MCSTLGADVLYLNPIHLAYTNHKYDALDFQQVSPEYGTRDDFKRLAADVPMRAA
jgi:glycosidase